MRRLVAASVIIAALSVLAGENKKSSLVQFHKTISQADRIVIRDGGYNCCGPVDKQKVLIELKDPKQVKEFNKLLQFAKKQAWVSCKCCGYPGIDWYKGKKRIALTAVHHGTALRWKGFPGDARFTAESSHKLSKWLLDHRVPDPHGELRKIKDKHGGPGEIEKK